MQRLTTYKCENCGKEFANSLECKEHESSCKNRRYLIEQLKTRLQRYLQNIEAQGFEVSIRYDTTATNGARLCLLSITERKKGKKSGK